MLPTFGISYLHAFSNCVTQNNQCKQHATAKNMLDKTEAAGTPVWILRLDLSKAFDRALVCTLIKEFQPTGMFAVDSLVRS